MRMHTKPLSPRLETAKQIWDVLYCLRLIYMRTMCDEKVSCVKRWSADLIKVYLGQGKYPGKCLDIISLVIRHVRDLWDASAVTWRTETREWRSSGFIWASSITESEMFISRSLETAGRSELSLRRCWDLFWNTNTRRKTDSDKVSDRLHLNKRKHFWLGDRRSSDEAGWTSFSGFCPSCDRWCVSEISDVSNH